jgi:membrane associated rhomboid family serine protease|tara:strand:- start:222 stop:1079 length:858 start_codon:yes stop_codon:yes gene_type:complete
LNELKKNPVTTILIISNVLIHILVGFTGGTDGTLGYLNLIKWGARYGPAIIDGEWWRLIVPIFLHIGIFHLFTNMIGLFVMARILDMEKVLGSFGYLVVYLLSGIIGNACSFYFSPNVGAGASGAIFGLFGTGTAFLILNRDRLGSTGKDTLLAMLFIVGINIVIGLVTDGVDNTAHVAGLVGGFIIGIYVIPRQGSLFKIGPTTPGSEIISCKRCDGRGQLSGSIGTDFDKIQQITTCSICNGVGRRVVESTKKNTVFTRYVLSIIMVSVFVVILIMRKTTQGY